MLKFIFSPESSSSIRPGFWNQRLDLLPLDIGQATWIWFS